VFEYGSGSSTVYWARRAARVVSVEHDEEWYHRVEDLLKRRSLTNCTYILRMPVPLSAGAPASARSAAMPDRDFSSYVHAIDAYPDQSFDLVVVDGRARIDCLYRSIPKVRPGGCLVLDNSQRERYAAVVDELSRRYSARRFVGLVPCRGRGFGTTTVWRIA
jgi:precorrin-6B methylase 2